MVELAGPLDAVREDASKYRAPEEADGEPTEQSLVYRVGAIGTALLYAMDASTDSFVVGDDLKQVIKTATAQTPSDRYETVLHLRDKLQDVLTEDHT